MRVKQRVQSYKQKLRDEEEKQLHKKRLWIRNAGIAALLFVVAILLLIFRQNKLKAKSKEQINLYKKEEALRELEKFKVDVIEKNELIAGIQQKLQELNTQNAEIQNEDQSNLDYNSQKLIMDRLCESTLLTDRSWREFVELFEKIYIGFFDRLNSKWPNLTPSEVRLIALCRLKLENREIASMLGVSTDAVRQVKSRLRRKIERSTQENFFDLASNI